MALRVQRQHTAFRRRYATWAGLRTGGQNVIVRVPFYTDGGCSLGCSLLSQLFSQIALFGPRLATQYDKPLFIISDLVDVVWSDKRDGARRETPQ
jgi:hypothetical protein